MLVNLVESVSDDKLLQFWKALVCILVTDSGIVSDNKFWQLRKVFSPIDNTEFEKITLTRLLNNVFVVSVVVKLVISSRSLYNIFEFLLLLVKFKLLNSLYVWLDKSLENVNFTEYKGSIIFIWFGVKPAELNCESENLLRFKRIVVKRKHRKKAFGSMLVTELGIVSDDKFSQ